MLRILFAVSAFLAITGGPNQSQAPVLDRESLAGFWETSASGSIDGFFLSFASLTVGVYHRNPQPQSVKGYQALKDFDGRRLAVGGFDVTFEPGQRRWIGTLYLAPFDERRYGELLEVSTENGEVRLRLTQYLTGPPLEYRGTVSPDGRMSGSWVRVGIDQDDTWKLNAPTIFVRQP